MASIILGAIFPPSLTDIKQTEKETLALLLSLQHFDVYSSTTTTPVDVYTDHNPLVFIEKMENKNQRLLRWSLAFQEYNLRIHHITLRGGTIS